ncbi:hypothetical protein B7C42_07991 [Nocardia cerradoensis]|uniref:Uncharacterized protein n=1 Tax=Nocardia cerradoensis TaxID=85688 RepID=A0A231GTM3_9NOCA|nr:hypothetical protein B7C42_07991 [Nocardia cerradoensis]
MEAGNDVLRDAERNMLQLGEEARPLGELLRRYEAADLVQSPLEDIVRLRELLQRSEQLVSDIGRRFADNANNLIDRRA